MLTFFSLGDEFVTSTLEVVSGIFSDTKILILLIMGVFLGIYIVERIIITVLTERRKK